MAIKGAALVTDLLADDPTHFKITVKWAGFDGSESIEGTVNIENVSPTVSSVTLEANIKSAVQTEIEAGSSITFGPLDSVRLIGALL